MTSASVDTRNWFQKDAWQQYSEHRSESNLQHTIVFKGIRYGEGRGQQQNDAFSNAFQVERVAFGFTMMLTEHQSHVTTMRWPAANIFQLN
jgi:hypothetical protein